MIQITKDKNLKTTINKVKSFNAAKNLMLKSVPSASIHIPDHTIIEKIGSGGMSSVYLGRQISLQRKVAIKVLKTLVMDDQDLAERFVHEAKTIASLDHPHIIAIYEAKKLPSGLTYFTMPYLNHGNFGDIICTNAFSNYKL